MTGLELSRAYWEQVAAPELQAAFPKSDRSHVVL